MKNDFLQRVMETRLAEQMEAAGKPLDKRQCSQCGRMLKPRHGITESRCWYCREPEEKAAGWKRRQIAAELGEASE